MPWLARKRLPMQINPGAGLHNPSLWTGELFSIILCDYFLQVVCITFCRKLASNILLELLALDERLHDMTLHTLFTNVANIWFSIFLLDPNPCFLKNVPALLLLSAHKLFHTEMSFEWWTFRKNFLAGWLQFGFVVVMSIFSFCLRISPLSRGQHKTKRGLASCGPSLVGCWTMCLHGAFQSCAWMAMAEWEPISPRQLALPTATVKIGMGSNLESFVNATISVWSIPFSMLVPLIVGNFVNHALITLLYLHHCLHLSIHVLFFIALGSAYKRLPPLDGEITVRCIVHLSTNSAMLQLRQQLRPGGILTCWFEVCWRVLERRRFLPMCVLLFMLSRWTIMLMVHLGRIGNFSIKLCEMRLRRFMANTNQHRQTGRPLTPKWPSPTELVLWSGLCSYLPSVCNVIFFICMIYTEFCMLGFMLHVFGKLGNIMRVCLSVIAVLNAADSCMNFTMLGQAETMLALGPKRRRYDVPLAEQPSAGEWEEFFRQPASAGGCAADILSNSQQFLERDLHFPAVQSYAAVCSQAEMDYKAVRQLLWSHPFRKSVPTWSVPAEIWRMLLYPNVPSASRRSGLGFRIAHFDNTMVHKRLFQGFAAVRRYNRTLAAQSNPQAQQTQW